MVTTIGALDSRITIERATETADSIGQVVKTWSTLITCFASVNFISGSESLRASREVAAKTARFTIRHSEKIKANDRVKYDGDYYDILNIRDLPGNYTEILAEVLE